jgi:hypothetical protein
MRAKNDPSPILFDQRSLRDIKKIQMTQISNYFCSLIAPGMRLGKDGNVYRATGLRAAFNLLTLE